MTARGSAKLPDRQIEIIGKSIEKGIRRKIRDMEELLDIHRRSLAHQRKTAAMYAVAPPEIALPIEKKREEIESLEKELDLHRERLQSIEQSGYRDIAESYTAYLAQNAQGGGIEPEKAIDRAEYNKYIEDLARKAR